MAHWNERKVRKLTIAKIASAFMAGLMLIGLSEWRGASANSTNALLEIQRFNSGIAELSGITLRPNAHAGFDLFGIGDKNGLISTIPLTPSPPYLESSPKAELFDLTGLLMASMTPCDPSSPRQCPDQFREATGQWEALTTDASGRFYALQEPTDLIVGFSPDLKRIEFMLHLDLTIGDHAKAKKSAKRRNSRGEGLLLLKSGRALVAMETKPAVLIEVGPEGTSGRGYAAEDRLNSSEAFQISTKPDSELGIPRSRLVGLAKWQLNHEGEPCDAADLALDQQGRLLVLSQSCRMIFAIDKLPVGEHQAKIAQAYSLPNRIRHAEALAVLPNGDFIIGQDLKFGKPSLSVLTLANSDSAAIGSR